MSNVVNVDQSQMHLFSLGSDVNPKQSDIFRHASREKLRASHQTNHCLANLPWVCVDVLLILSHNCIFLLSSLRFLEISTTENGHLPSGGNFSYQFRSEAVSHQGIIAYVVPAQIIQHLCRAYSCLLVRYHYLIVLLHGQLPIGQLPQ